jgi:hypothetical protein
MNRPKSIKISGQKYRIKYDLDDPDAYGMTDSATNTIRLRDNLPEDKMIRVFMHEMTHAVIFETPMSTRKRFDVEEVCDIVGYHIFTALKDNPEIVEYILREIVDEAEDA